MIAPAKIEAVVASVDFGRPSWAKRGRNPRFPYVPVIEYATDDGLAKRTEQLLALAYVERRDAVAAAARTIESRRRSFAAKLADPRHRTLRESYGLPREIA